MKSKIESGQLCTVEPVDPVALKVGDIVLFKVNGKQYLHLVKAGEWGRLLWLKAFTKAEIESTFKEKSKFKKRTFDFTYSADGLVNDTVTEADIKTQMTKTLASSQMIAR
jgi:hypothetical protein